MMRPKTFMIYPPLEKQMSGPLTFAGHLKDFLEKNGYRCETDISEGLGVLIVFVQAPVGFLRKARSMGVPILLRLDGVYYPRKHGLFHRQYLSTNLKVWLIRRFFCDYIVYQSMFSHRMLNALLGKSGRPFGVIHNGISLPAAEGSAEHRPGPGGPERPLRFAATGRFRGDDMLPITVKALDLCSGRFPFTLDVYGSVDAEWRSWLERPYIRAFGKIPNERVRGLLPDYDALVFTQTSPSCPNVVIEAMAAGLPVLAFDTGSVREILGFNLELLAGTPDRLLHGVQDLDPVLLAERITSFAADPRKFRDAASEHKTDMSEDRTLAKYAETLEKLRTEDRK